MRKLLSLAALLAVATPALADHHESDAPAAQDYALPQNWLCLPGHRDACSVSLATTRVDADGSMTVEENAPAENPAYDCFYVYPTVSDDPTPHSDMIANDEERRVILLQAAPFAQNCHVYAPLYRQVTLMAIRRGIAGGGWEGVSRERAYNDVKAAWDHYLADHNNGRGVVLIGHSQGSGLLTQLIANEIDGSDVGDRMISALIIGSNVGVTEGADSGGQLGSIPVCRSADQFGCVVSFVSFRSDVPPTAETRFGRVATPGQEAICANPGALSGGPVALDAWMSNSSIFTPQAETVWADGGAPVTTDFVRVPGLLSGECVSNGGANYLSVTVNADASDPRTDDIPGDLIVGGQRIDSWGLHLIDMNLAMGNMVALVEQQAAAWMAAQPTE
jgi:hypothetical protein